MRAPFPVVGARSSHFFRLAPSRPRAATLGARMSTPAATPAVSVEGQSARGAGSTVDERLAALPRLGVGISTEPGSAARGGIDALAFREEYPGLVHFLE